MRSILLHVHDDDCLEARLQAALGVARAFDAHVTCLQAMPFELGVPGDLYGTMAAQLLPEIRERAAALRERLELRLASEDARWDWVQEDGIAGDQLLRRAGLGDLVVLGSCEPLRKKGPSALVADVVLRSKTPVLVVPPDTGTFDCEGPAVVAWDGSPEASRALRGAAPLLAKASAVTLVTITDRNGHSSADLPPIEGAQYLSRHGIACELTDIPLHGGSVAELLAGAAAVRRASYLVMGAYGHWRLLETIWGGVTQELFSTPPLPIIACH